MIESESSIDIHTFVGEHKHLVETLYAEYPHGVTLPPEYASFVDRDLLRLLIRLARYKFVARLLKSTDRVLEVGCGSGLGAIFMAQHCSHVTGIDLSDIEINEAKQMSRRQNVAFVAGDFFEFPASHQYDVIVNLDVIEHFDLTGGERLIAKMAQHVKNSGMLVLGTPSVYSYPYQGALSKAAHIKCYDQKELLALIDQYFRRTLAFSMNDELVHTGHPKLAWYYFVLALSPNRHANNARAHLNGA